MRDDKKTEINSICDEIDGTQNKKIHDIVGKSGDLKIQCIKSKRIERCSRKSSSPSVMIKLKAKLHVPDNLWSAIYDSNKNKLVPKKYNHVICDLRSIITNCQINIKSKDVMKNHIVIRAYCGQSMNIGNEQRKHCSRVYHILNRNLARGIFEISQSNARSGSRT